MKISAGIMILVLFSAFSNGKKSNQNFYDYDSAWAIVRNLYEQEGKTQSALLKVEEIYNRSVADKNIEEQYAAIQYKANNLIKEEKDVYNYINTELLKSSGLLKSMLLALKGDFFASSLLNSYGQDQTDLIDDTSEDIESMSRNGKVSGMIKNFGESLNNPDLFKVPLKRFKRSMISGDSIYLEENATLYEAIALRYTEHMKDDLGIKGISDFIYTPFQMLASLPDFLKLDITQDENSYLTIAAKSFQNILRSVKSPKLKFAIDNNRINYFRSKYGEDKYNDIIIKSLDYHISESNNEFVIVAASLEKAEILKSKIQNYGKIEKMLSELNKKYPDSRLKRNIEVSLSEINAPKLMPKLAEVYTSKQKKYFNIQSFNLSEITVTLSKVTATNESKIKALSNSYDFVMDVSEELVKKWDVNLTKERFKYHTQEISLGELSFGMYEVMISDKEGKLQRKGFFQVTDLAAVKIDQLNKLYTHDRISGELMAGVKADLYISQFSRETRSNEIRKSNNLESDKNGEISLFKANEYYSAVLSKNNDSYIIGTNLYFGFERNKFEQEDQRRNLIFTDRSVYRPGQTIYFKTLAYSGKNNNLKTVSNQPLNLVFRDVNGVEITRINESVTNSFGSFSGSFVIPKGRLNGYYSIAVNDDYHTILVEEYKRPGFEVKEVKSQAATSRKETSILTASAIGLAGNVLNDIDYSYSVERTVARPRCYWWPIREDYYTIKKGKGKTDNDGQAKVEFNDVAEVYNVDQYSMLTYKVTINFTDQTGESHELIKYYSFSDQEYYITIESPEVVQNANVIKIRAYTANNDSTSAKGKLYVYQYKLPDILEFKNFDDEEVSGYEEFDLSRYQLIKTLDFATSQHLDLKLEGGDYLLSAQSTTKSGQKVRFDKVISVADFDKGKFGGQHLVYHRISKNKAVPGDKIILDLGSQMKTHTRLLVVRKDEILFNQFTPVNNTTCMSYTVKEEDRGGVAFYYFSILNNRFEYQSVPVEVPFDNKHLDIQYESVRDLLYPGQKEKHVLTIRFKDKKADSEVLAALYDASLDLLHGHQWSYSLYHAGYHVLNVSFYGFQEAGIMYAGDQGSYYEPVNKGENIPNILYQNGNFGYGMHKMMSRSAIPMAESAPAEMQSDQATVADVLKGKTAGTAIVQKPVENQVRENLKETVFFYPHVKSDATGKVIYEFTMNEALTRWRLMTLAHTTDMKLGYKETYITTRKDLMIKANKPRIVRFNDKVYLTANVSNLTDKRMNVSASIQLNDFSNDASVNWVKNNNQNLIIESKQTKGISWLIEVPDNTNVELLSFTVSASSEGHKDAERDVIPVAPDKIWLTHSIPFHLSSAQSGSYTIPNFGSEISDKSHTLEINTNPAWVAFSSLPALDIANPRYAADYMNRLYQYSTAKEILQNNPEFKKLLQAVPDQPSKLTQNQELKNMILEATPFVRSAKNEEDNYTSMKKYLDDNMVSMIIQEDIQSIKNLQGYDGGFTYYVGVPSNLYTTTEILTKIIKLEDAKVLSKSAFEDTKQRATDFIMMKMEEAYNQLKSRSTPGPDGGGSFIDELYILAKTNRLNEVKSNNYIKYYLDGVYKNWLKSAIIHKIKIDYISEYAGNNSVSKLIKAYFDENKVVSKEQGIFWEEAAWKGWRRLSISEHAALINYYHSKNASKEEIDQMKIWLLKHKQVQGWPSYQTTSDAVFALMNVGSKKEVTFMKNVPDFSVVGMSNPFILNPNAVGLIKSSTSQDLSGKTVNINNKADHIIYGGLFSGFYQKADKIIPSQDNPLSIKKEFYREIKTQTGDRLERISDNSVIVPGDVLVSRIILKLDRDMDYLTLTDTRPAGFEPVKEKNSFWWYKPYTTDITDYQANYFFYHLNKGSHTIENRIIAVHKGEFCGGIARFQSYYSPEFVSYTEGSRVGVK